MGTVISGKITVPRRGKTGSVIRSATTSTSSRDGPDPSGTTRGSASSLRSRQARCRQSGPGARAHYRKVTPTRRKVRPHPSVSARRWTMRDLPRDGSSQVRKSGRMARACPTRSGPDARSGGSHHDRRGTPTVDSAIRHGASAWPPHTGRPRCARGPTGRAGLYPIRDPRLLHRGVDPVRFMRFDDQDLRSPGLELVHLPAEHVHLSAAKHAIHPIEEDDHDILLAAIIFETLDPSGLIHERELGGRLAEAWPCASGQSWPGPGGSNRREPRALASWPVGDGSAPCAPCRTGRPGWRVPSRSALRP